MPERCINCRLNKTKVSFNIDRTRAEVQEQAIKQGITFAIYRKGKGIAYCEAEKAVNSGYIIIELISKHD